MRRSTATRILASAGVALVILGTASCGGDDDATTEGTDRSVEETQDIGGSDDGSDLDVDNCTLLTDDEVSGLAGKPLVHGEDGPLGCGWAEADAVVDDFSIDSFRSDRPLSDTATELAPGLDVHELLGGRFDEAIALFDGDEANFLLARRGERHVLLVMTFLDVTSGEPLAQATHLAEVALDRLEG